MRNYPNTLKRKLLDTIWQYEKSAEHSARDTEKKPSIRERLEQGKKECAAKQTPTATKSKNEQEL